MDKQNRIRAIVIIAGIWLTLTLLNGFASNAGVKTIPYSQFLRMAEEGNITDVSVTDNIIQGKMLTDSSPSGEGERFQTVRVDSDLNKSRVEINISPKWGIRLFVDKNRRPLSALLVFVVLMLIFTIASPEVFLSPSIYSVIFKSLPIRLILVVSLVIYLNYDYYLDFFSSSIKSELIEILLLNIVLIIIGILFVFFKKLNKKWMQALFLIILSLNLINLYTTIYRDYFQTINILGE